MDKIKYYYKVEKYYERKETLEDIKVDIKKILGLNKETVEQKKLRYERKRARRYLKDLIFDLLFEKSSYEITMARIYLDELIYEVKTKIKENKILNKWFEYYNIDINFISKTDVDTLFIIMKKI